MAGAGGMLGEAFYQVFKEKYTIKCTDIDLNDDWLAYTDITNYSEYRDSVLDFRPDFLFHLGAITDLEQCELNPSDAYLTNTLSVENACSIAEELDIPLLYISTAGIFDGCKDIYDDWDTPSPLGVYGRSKYLGEQIVQSRTSKHFICRAGWMMGGGIAKDKKFIKKIMDQILGGCDVLHIVNDKLGTPTYTYDFANNVLQLIETPYYGLYNMVCGGTTGRLEVATEILAHLGLTDSIKIQSVPSDYFKDQYFAARPASERLINTKLILRNLNSMNNWKDSLHHYLDTAYKQLLN